MQDYKYVVIKGSREVIMPQNFLVAEKLFEAQYLTIIHTSLVSIPAHFIIHVSYLNSEPLVSM